MEVFRERGGARPRCQRARSVLVDVELLAFLRNEPELLAIVDAIQATVAARLCRASAMTPRGCQLWFRSRQR